MDSVLTGVLCMGPGVPNSSSVQQMGGSVTAWCWILADSGRFLAKRARRLRLMTQLSAECGLPAKCSYKMCILWLVAHLISLNKRILSLILFSTKKKTNNSPRTGDTKMETQHTFPRVYSWRHLVLYLVLFLFRVWDTKGLSRCIKETPPYIFLIIYTNKISSDSCTFTNTNNNVFPEHFTFSQRAMCNAVLSQRQ